MPVMTHRGRTHREPTRVLDRFGLLTSTRLLTQSRHDSTPRPDASVPHAAAAGLRGYGRPLSSPRPPVAVTISYEAQARLRDPIYGCVAHIFVLQHSCFALDLHSSVGAAAGAGVWYLIGCGGSDAELSVEDKANLVASIKNTLQGLASRHMDVLESLELKVRKRVEKLREIQV
ncbi:uncharacterized protein LOC133927556 [Phragmites australis]|uniref:uncharacterized protein LOC133927556 n=1 Tax=Phragmites australis TaxID=29695 RepID=UPI002D7715FD|nr:uncharacterized protein LOC133927556 [Phragmites australis]